MQPKTLVRFRGMIQDMLGNEFYAGAYKVYTWRLMFCTKEELNLYLSITVFFLFLLFVKDDATWRTNKYSDISHFPEGSSSKMQVWERRLLYCVPVCFLSVPHLYYVVVVVCF